MNEEYKLKVIYNGEEVLVKAGTLKEIDEFTCGVGEHPGFENDQELLKSLNLEALASINARVVIMCTEKKGAGANSYFVNGVVYKQDDIIFNNNNLIKYFYSYQTARTAENAAFITIIAEIYSKVEGFERLCKTMESNLYVDYSNQYYDFLSKIRNQYNTVRNLYFISKRIREIDASQPDMKKDEILKKYLTKITEERELNHQQKDNMPHKNSNGPVRYIFPSDYDGEVRYGDRGRHI